MWIYILAQNRIYEGTCDWSDNVDRRDQEEDEIKREQIPEQKTENERKTRVWWIFPSLSSGEEKGEGGAGRGTPANTIYPSISHVLRSVRATIILVKRSAVNLVCACVPKSHFHLHTTNKQTNETAYAYSFSKHTLQRPGAPPKQNVKILEVEMAYG